MSCSTGAKQLLSSGTRPCIAAQRDKSEFVGFKRDFDTALLSHPPASSSQQSAGWSVPVVVGHDVTALAMCLRKGGLWDGDKIEKA